MDLFTHAVAQRGVHQLVALDQAFAGKCVRYDDRIEMLAVAFDLDMRTFEAGGNIVL
jgi:hypothetical protein